jgi:hypothetical protein
MGATALQESGSIYTFYSAIEKGVSLEPMVDSSLREGLLKIYPKMDAKWYTTFLKQAKALNGYIGHREGSKDNSWKYGWYDGAAPEIPRTKQTDIINYIWDKFTSEQKRNFGNKKDSWNTADVYIMKTNAERQIKSAVDELDKTFNDGNYTPDVFVGTVNAYMSQALRKKLLIPISLKKVTAAAPKATLKEANLDTGPDGLVNVTGSIDKVVKTVFEIQNRGGELDFNTNSLTTSATFTAGKYTTKYFWETRMSGANQKTELKDLVQNNTGKYVKAEAQAGSIPVPLMKELVREFSKEDYDSNLSNNLDSHKKYWQDYLKDIIKDTTISKDFGGMTIMGKQVSPDEFISQAIELDNMSASDVRTLYKCSKSDFSNKIRQKLRQLRIIKSFINAKKSGDLPEFLATSYYRAAKLNLSQADLSGPFVKIQ